MDRKIYIQAFVFISVRVSRFWFLGAQNGQLHSYPSTSQGNDLHREQFSHKRRGKAQPQRCNLYMRRVI